MNYINTQTTEYPVTENQIRSMFPSYLFGAQFVAPEPFKVVVPTTKPNVNPLTSFVREATPVLGPNSEFVQQWEIVEYDQSMKDAMLDAQRTSIWTAIKSIRDNRILTGGYTTGGKWFHSDLLSRSQQMALVMMGANVPNNLQWKTMDGSFVTMTQQLATEIFAAAAESDQKTFAFAEELRAQVNAANDPTTIDVYIGWPAVFGEI